MFCSNCGNKLPDGARFCSFCGVRVAEEVEKPFKIELPEFDYSDDPATKSARQPAETPLKTRVTFDWSNVIDEPQRKTVQDIKSPWSTTGSIDEKELYAEMTPSTDRSRTMSFIDVLRAEKEQAEAEKKAGADMTPGSLETEEKAADAAPELHIAPLYDLDQPVVTPFDLPEEEEEAKPEEEPSEPMPFCRRGIRGSC